MNAATAKANSAEWLQNAQRENKEYNRKRIAREKRESAEMWKTRGVEWVRKIDGYIARASKEGKHHTYEPSDLNPNGDLVIWLAKCDGPIHKMLIEHYRDNGFEVTEYTPLGLMIEW